ncbi:hypothetical protein FN846DRAFT_991730 [Sphaerosporella brunnea]|uniref:NACHT domain-containing protein n=1 Tax=Sphaerosporella brunnea TaxID=1250544 RepID=A0A5J5EP54_9PEZI|nr:hypothetical protein FN846DRAFT_991730 [Sphaerosporella brunnea]
MATTAVGIPELPPIHGSSSTANKSWKQASERFNKFISKENLAAEIEQSMSPQDLIKTNSDRLLKFSAVIDGLAAGGPGGGVVWGSIRCALSLVKSHAEQYEKLLEALVFIAESLPGVDMYANTFLDSARVQECILDFYESIMRFWQRAIKFYRRRRLWNFFRSSWKDYSELETQMRKHLQRLEKAGHEQHMFEAKLSRINQEKLQEDLHSWQNSEKYKAIVQWLAPLNHEVNYYVRDLEAADTLRYRDNNGPNPYETCQWILPTAEFQAWDNATAPSLDAFMWVYAIPGAGKTVLSSFVISSLSNRMKKPEELLVYFFFKNTDDEKNTALVAVQSLLYQCFISSEGQLRIQLEAELIARVNTSGTNKAKDFQLLWDLFYGHIRRSGSITIVLDALDECRGAENLIKCLRELCQTTTAKVILTSRREKHLVEVMDGCSAIEVRPEDIQEDVKAFVAFKIDRNPKLYRLPQLREQIINTLVQGSRGMFLWVNLMIKELKSKPSVLAIEKALSDLPYGLNAVYAQILHRLEDSLEPSLKELCQIILGFVVTAVRPLTTEEMKELLTMHYAPRDAMPADFEVLYSEKDIQLACGSLVTIRDKTFRVLHLSTKEFLGKNPEILHLQGKAADFLVDSSRTHSLMTTLCVFYLHWKCTTNAFDDIRKSHEEPAPSITMRNQKFLPPDELRKKFPLVEYAALQFPSHFIDGEAHARECCRSISAWLSPALLFLWAEICFVLNPDASWRVRVNLDVIADNLVDIEESAAQRVSSWMKVMLLLLNQYGHVLEKWPSAIDSIDPMSLFADSVGLEEYIRSRNSNHYDEHKVLDGVAAPQCKDDPSKFRLDPGSHYPDYHIFLRFDEKRSCLFFMTKAVDGAVLHCQDWATGRTLVPQRLTLPTGDECDFTVEEVAMSENGRYVAIAAGRNTKCVGRHPWDYYFYFQEIVGVWEVVSHLDFTNRSRMEMWTFKIGSWRVPLTRAPRYPENFTRMSPPYSLQSSAIAFSDYGWFVTPRCRVHLASGLVEVDIFPESHEDGDVMELETVYALSGDGKKLLKWITPDDRDNDNFGACQVLSARSDALPSTVFVSINHEAQVLGLSYTGRFAIFFEYQFSPPYEYRTYIYDTVGGTKSLLLVSQQKLELCRFTADDETLALIKGCDLYGRDELDVWTELSSGTPRLIGRLMLPGPTGWFDFDSKNSSIYIVSAECTLEVLGLNTLSIVEPGIEDDALAIEAQGPAQISSQMSCDGRLLAVMGFSREKKNWWDYLS